MNKTSFVMSAPVLRSKKEQGKPFTASIQSILSRLQDPRDQNMHLIVSVLTLLFDAALSALIIARVPCALPSPDLFRLALEALIRTRHDVEPCYRHRNRLGGVYGRGGGLFGR